MVCLCTRLCTRTNDAPVLYRDAQINSEESPTCVTASLTDNKQNWKALLVCISKIKKIAHTATFRQACISWNLAEIYNLRIRACPKLWVWS